MSDILDEALSDHKHEKSFMIFKRSLPVIVVLSIVIAIIISLFNWNKNKKIAYNKERGDKLVSLVSNEIHNKTLNTKSLQQFIDNSDNKQSELAKLKMVSNLIVDKKFQTAIEMLETIISDVKNDEITISFSRLLLISIALDQKSISDKLHAKITDCFNYFRDEKHPFFANATLMRAMFYKKNGKKDLAYEYANIVIDSEYASLIVKEQAKALLANMN